MHRVVLMVLIVSAMLMSALPASSQAQDPCEVGVQPPPAQCVDGGGETDPRIQRLAGPTRVETALAISAATFAATDTVVIVRADLYPDAVVAGPYAAAVGGPVLLAGVDGLGQGTTEEIGRLGATRAVIIGGPAAVPVAVEEDLVGLGLDVDRLAGASRVATALTVADAMVDLGAVGRTAVLTLGEGDDGWLGPIAFGPAAAALNAPLLLTPASVLPDEVAGWITDNIDTVVVGDGPGRVGPDVAEAVAATGVEVDRPVRTDDPYTASVVAAEQALAAGADPAVVYVVTDRAFADGLGAGASAATNDGVVVIVDGDDPDGAPQVEGFLTRYCQSVSSVRIAGGPAAVTETVEDRLSTAMSCEPPSGPMLYFTQPEDAYETAEDTADLVVATSEGDVTVELLVDRDGDGTYEATVATLDVEADGGIADFVDIGLAEGPNRFAARATRHGEPSRTAPAPTITRRIPAGGTPSGPDPLDDQLDVVSEQGVVVGDVLDEYVADGTIVSYDADPDFDRLARATTTPGGAEDAKATLEADDRIAEANRVFPNESAQVDDPQAEQQAQLDDVQPEGAWAVTNDGAGYTVGIIDGGFDDAHEDLPTFLVHQHHPAENCVSTHGTQVAGIILARAGAPGITGLANQGDLVAFSGGRTGPTGECSQVLYDDGDLRRMAVGDNPVDVLNTSFGTTWQGNAATHGRDMVTGTGRQHYDYVTNRGVLVVASSGNGAGDEGYDRDTAFHTPSGFDQVMSVGATRTGTSSWAEFSQWEPEVDLVAPGTPVVSTTNGSAYESVHGTSFATPHVTGAAVLVSQATGDTEPWRIRHRLTDHAQDINGADRTDRLGEGLLDITDAATRRAVRLAGGDRFGTAEEIGREALPSVPEGSDPDRAHLVERVVIVPARNWQVALPAMALAHETDTTVVTSEEDRLPAASLRELRRALGIDMGFAAGETSLDPTEALAIYPGVAGQGGVSEAVRSTVDNAGLADRATTRVELPGSNAHGIAVGIANHLIDRSGEPTDVLIATTNGFADALALGAAAAYHGHPLLYSDIDGVANVTCDWLADRPSLSTIHIAGGLAAVSDAAAEELQGCAGSGVTVVRHAGGERVETAVRIAEFFFPVGSDYSIRPALASAEIPADSIIGGLLAAHTHGPVYITRNGTAGPGQPVRPLEGIVAGSVGGTGGQHYTTGYVLGGTAVIGDHLYDDWDSALGGDRTAPPPPGADPSGPGPYTGEFVQVRDQLLCDDSRPAATGEDPTDGGRIELTDPIQVHDLCNANGTPIGIEWTYTMSAADAGEVDDIIVLAWPNRTNIQCDDLEFVIRGTRTGGTWDANIHEVGNTANCNLHEVVGPVRSGDARVVDFDAGNPDQRFVGMDWLVGSLPSDDYVLFMYAGSVGEFDVGDVAARIRVD